MQRFRLPGAVCLALTILAAASCSRAREYELRGQVLAVDPARRELTVKHEDIRGFMPGMTMPFKVRDAAALGSRKPGEMIRATLVVEQDEGYLKDISSTGTAPLTAPPPRPRVDILKPGEPIPDTILLDESARARTLADWRGHVLAVTFIYTRCPVPDFCPLVDRRFAEVQKAAAADAALRERVRLISITFDPAHDTPAVLAAHARKVGADPAFWSFLTGEREAIEGIAARFGVSIVSDPASAPEIVHNLRTAVVDGRGRLVETLSGNDWAAEKLLDVLRSASAGR
jgi:protein SCO1/2